MSRPVRVLAALVFLLAWVPSTHLHAGALTGPLRIVLLVDSSSPVASVLTQFRQGLSTFVESLSGEPELAFVTTGGQLRVRVPPTTDRDRIRKSIASFSSDGGGNAFVDSLLEADKRFFMDLPDRRPVFVIVTTDTNLVRSEQRIDAYNKFVGDFMRRGGRAHGIVIRGTTTTMTTDVLANLTDNTGGFFESLTIANALSDRMKTLVQFVEADMP